MPTEEWFKSKISEAWDSNSVNINFDEFIECLENGDKIEIFVEITVKDELNREIKKEYSIDCFQNIFIIKKQDILFNVETETIQFQALIEDRYHEGYSGELLVKITDEYNTVLDINEKQVIDDGVLSLELVPRTVFGLSPQIRLIGTISYSLESKTHELNVFVSYGKKEDIKSEFELKTPQVIESGRSLTFELASDSYQGPVWLIYGKNEIFAQVNGILTEKNRSFKHEIKIPKSYVGDLTCVINYFNFKETMEIKSTERIISVSLNEHTLPFSIDFPSRAQPGDIVQVTFQRVAKSLEPWLVALKLADKSLRGLDAMTEIDLNQIYSLAQKLKFYSLTLWTKDLNNILRDLGSMIYKAITESNYEPNIFILLFELDSILRKNFDSYNDFCKQAKMLMTRYFNNLWSDVNNIIEFFLSLSERNFQIVVANFGNYFLPQTSLFLKQYDELYTVINERYSKKHENMFKELLKYINEIFLSNLEGLKEQKFDFLFQLQDLDNTYNIINRLKKLILFIIDFGKKYPNLISKELIIRLKSFLKVVSSRTFLKKLFLKRYKYGFSNWKCIRLLAKEIETIEQFKLNKDKKIISAFIDANYTYTRSIEWIFKEYIDVEKDEIWKDLISLKSFLKTINIPKNEEKLGEIIDFLFSKEFTKRIFNVHRNKYPFYEYIEKDITKINNLSNNNHRNWFIEEILDDISSNLFEPFNYLNYDNIIANILFHRFCTLRLLELINWEGIKEEILKVRKRIRNKLEMHNYFQGVLKNILEPISLNSLIIESPKRFEETLLLWQKRAKNGEEYDFKEIGEFPPPLNVKLKGLFENAFGNRLSDFFKIFYTKIGKTYLHLLKKAKYHSVNNYIDMIKFWKRVEFFLIELEMVLSESSNLKELQDDIKIIKHEKLFNILYFYFLNEIKGNKINISEFYEFQKIIELFQGKIPNKTIILQKVIFQEVQYKEFNLKNDFTHLPEKCRLEILFYLISNFIIRTKDYKIQPKKESTLLRDFQYYINLTDSAMDVIRTSPIGTEEDKQSLIETGTKNNNFKSFWSVFNCDIPILFESYVVNTLIELTQKTSEIDRELERAIYKNLISEISKNFEEFPLFGTLWYYKPNEPKNFHEKWNNIINVFNAHPMAEQFQNELHLLKYFFIASEEQIKQYYEEIIRKFSQTEVPYFNINDLVWFGTDDLNCFPNIIGYPKYTSIMTDVEHYGTYRDYKVTKAPPSVATSKKHTIRKNFEDIGYYQIIPYFTKESETFSISLPDSITTQELHIAAFNERCKMNYKISDVQVTQEFFIKEDLPDILNWKDQIEANIVITNTTSDEMSVKVKIEQNDEKNPDAKLEELPIEIEYLSPLEFTLEPKDIKNIELNLEANQCGRFLIRIIADTEKYTDEVHKVIRIKAGFPSDVSQTFEFLHSDSKETSVEKKFLIKIPSDVVDHEYFVSIYPSLTSHILDGIEANMRYPYGCIEQIFSALMPNLVYYDYLMENSEKKGEIVEKIKHNIINGYLKLQAKQNHDGGFGWWAHRENSIFLTATVLFAYKLLYKHGFLMESYTIKEIVEFLLKKALDKKSFYWHLPKDKNQERKLSRFTDLTLTNYVIHALQQIRDDGLFNSNQEFLFQRVVDWLNTTISEDITDCYNLYLFYNNYRDFNPNKLPTLTKQILKYRLKPFWLQGSAIGSDVETTARLTQTLWKNNRISETERNKILEWIYQQKSPYGGWKTTSDTRAVVELLTSLLENETCDLYISIQCNGIEIIKEKHITLENLSRASYDLQYIPLNKYIKTSKNGAKNILTISVKGNGAPAVKLVQESWIKRELKPLEGLEVKRNCEKTNIKRYKNTTITLELTIPKELDEMIVVEEPLIPATIIEQESLDDLVKNGVIIGSKYVNGKIAFFLPSGKEKKRIIYEIRSTKRFRGLQSPTKVYPMYEPHKAQHGNNTRYSFQ
jgi:hypothetical protein